MLSGEQDNLVWSAKDLTDICSGDLRNPNVDKIHLLKRITLELKEIQTLQTLLAGIQGMLGIVDTDIT
jgi:hypothetical protein